MKARERLGVALVGGIGLFLLLSCADRDAPTKDQVQNLLSTFYGQQGYKVTSIDLGAIEGAPLAQKKYGQRRTFYITVKRLTLEGTGRQAVRGNGTIIIRQRPGTAVGWTVEYMPPELAP